MSTPPALLSDARPIVVYTDVLYATHGLPVVVGFKWEIVTGSVNALLGLSGAGKSSLLALTAGVMKPDAGSITLNGRPSTEISARRSLGYMPQQGGLYTDLSVEDNLRVFAAGAGMHAKTEEAVSKTLELLLLSARRRDLVRDLPAGIQQRVSLGAALVAAPQVLILDEPLSLADAEFTERAWAHFYELAAKGRTVLIGTCHTETAARAQQIGVLRNGRLVASHVGDTLAPVSSGKLILHFREKSGLRKEEVNVTDYIYELPGLLAGLAVKPTGVEVVPNSRADQLRRILLEDV